MTTHLLLRLYDWFARHRFLRLALPLVLVLAALASASQLHFKEDITDFLPNNDNYRRSMEVYRQTNAADRIVIVASGARHATTGGGKPSAGMEINGTGRC